MGQNTQTGLTSVTGSVESVGETEICVQISGIGTVDTTVPAGKVWFLKSYNVYSEGTGDTDLIANGFILVRNKTTYLTINASNQNIQVDAAAVIRFKGTVANDTVSFSYVERTA